MNKTKSLLVTAAAFAGCGLVVMTGQEPARTGVYTAAQSEAGRIAYLSTCGKCHTATLMGRVGDPSELPPVSSLPPNMQETVRTYSGKVPPLAGPNFLARWGAGTTKELSKRIKEAVGGFPPEGTNEETYLKLTAYVLQVNGAQPGTQPLTADTAVEVNSLRATGR